MAYPITRATFLATWREFAATPPAVIDQQITWAATQVDPNIFGKCAEEAHGLLVAHKLTLSPGGQQGRLDPKTLKAIGAQDALETTTYGIQFVQLRQAATVGLRVF